MSKPEGFTQDTIDAVVGLERKYGDGHHSFELREGIFDLILAAKAEERERISAACEAKKYTDDQGMDQEMHCFNDGVDAVLIIVRGEG